jgi:hypothetical protein
LSKDKIALVEKRRGVEWKRLKRKGKRRIAGVDKGGRSREK